MDVFPEGEFFEGEGALNKAKKAFKRKFKGLHSSEDDNNYSILVMDSVNKRYGFASLKTIWEHLHVEKDKRYSLCEVYDPAPYHKVFADIEVTDVDLEDFKNYMFKLLADLCKYTMLTMLCCPIIETINYHTILYLICMSRETQIRML